MAEHAGEQSTIHGILLPVDRADLLLPYAAVAEVVTLEREAIAGEAPGPLAGRVRWRGWTVPVVSWGALCGWDDAGMAARVHVAVLYNTASEDAPYFGLLLREPPRSQLIHETNFPPAADPPGCRYAAQGALLGGKTVLIPDLAAVTGALEA